MNTLDFLDKQSLRSDIPEFRPGDTLNVHVKVIEGSKERVQIFKGVVIRRQGGGIRETFTVRKVSFGVGVDDFDGLAGIGRNYVAGFGGATIGGVLGAGNNADQVYGQFEFGGCVERTQHGRCPAHVAFHQVHVGRRFDGHTARIERDALAD